MKKIEHFWGEKQENINFRKQLTKRESVRNTSVNERLSQHFYAFYCIAEELN